VHVGINAGTKFRYDSTQNLMTHNTSKFQVDGGLGSADIVVLMRGVKNENFPCPARVTALKGATGDIKSALTLFFERPNKIRGNKVLRTSK